MLSNAPTVAPGEWILVGEFGDKLVDGYVFSINEDGSLEVGYYQNRIKAIREPIIWSGTGWKFKYNQPNGAYLRGNDEAIVKRGPRR